MKPLQTHGLRNTAPRLALPYTLALLAGCALGSDASDAARESSDGVALATHEQALIGGRPAAADQFRATVGINDDCTAAKVGPRLFLTAAHCVAVARPIRGMPVPEPFPPNDGLRDSYLPGQPLLIFWGLDADDPQQGEFTIVETTMHPSWWACPLCEQPIVSTGAAADIAVIQIAEDTPDIPQARVDLDPVEPGTALIETGWGCEERTDIDPQTLDLGRFKLNEATARPASEIRHHISRLSDDQVAQVDAGYVVTAGRAQDADNSSLCLGDSGGPLYLADESDPRIVGVNADYTFPPVENPEDGGVSWNDWHTRTSIDSQHGIGQWLRELGVNTVGGDSGSSECTCPSGCDAVQTASVPFMHSGVVDACFFFDDLGFGVNSHSMVEVNLNGRNITNQFVGNWSYPAERDGGYYLYLEGTKGWSWAQAIQ